MKLDAVGVVGLGQLGRGIAACVLAHGFRVVGFDPDPQSGERTRRYVRTALEELIARAGFSGSILADWEERLTIVSSLAGFGHCEFVIESVVEDLAIKSEVFDALEAVVGQGVPIASNTSALPISLLQSTRRHPERFLGMHWNDPAYATRFLELIRGEKTSEATFQAAVEFGLALSKEPALVQKDVPGFVANRLAYAMYREAVHLLETGVADVETIDRAFQNSAGFWASFSRPICSCSISSGK